MARADDVRALIAEVNTAYKGNILLSGDNVRKAKNIPRLPTGIIQVDEALGGGFPFGKISLWAGEYSTGKTQIAMRAASQTPLFDWKTKRRITKSNPGEPAYPFYVDAENALDYDWAELCGIDLSEDRAIVSQTESSEQCIDVVNRAIQSNLFSCIIVDSLAAMAPEKEIVSSSEDQFMGVQARLLNRAMRVWVASLTRIQTGGQIGPAVLLINQLRSKIGVMFGDNRTLPGGKGQEFASSIIGYALSPSYDTSNAKSENMSVVTLKGNVQKNKTFIPRQNYAFDLYLKDGDGFRKGEIDNVPYLITRGTSLGLIKKKGGKYTFGTDTFSTQKEMKEQLKSSPSLQLKLYRSVINAATGVLV